MEREAMARTAMIACALVVVLAGCTAGGGTGPAPTTAPAVATVPPMLVQGWWRTELPVDGDLLSLGAPSAGHVTVVRDGLAHIRITITGFATIVGADADLRVQLAGGDVTRRRHATVYLPDGDPVEVGTIDADAADAVVEFGNPQILPRSVHSLIVVDYTTDTQIAAAELIPGA